MEEAAVKSPVAELLAARGSLGAVQQPSEAGSPLVDPETSLQLVAEEVVSQLVRFMKTGASPNCANLPAIEVAPPRKNCHRIVHLHRSVPGVMSNINRVIASMGVNIIGQQLQTHGNHGYVILDVERQSTKSDMIGSFSFDMQTVAQLYLNPVSTGQASVRSAVCRSAGLR